MADVQKYVEKLKESGYRITPQRQAVLKALSKHKMQSVEEIHNKVLVNQSNVSLDTVYRNLRLLFDLNIIDETNFGDGKVRYKLADHHHHHLICIKCGCSEEINFCPLELVREKIKNKNFKVTDHNFEIFGYCSNCL